MKTKTPCLLILAAAAVYGLASCDKHDHDHADGDHKHEDGDGKAGHDDREGYDHAAEAGPNGGRVLTDYEPRAEFLVTDDRKVRITFLSEELKPIPAAGQEVSVIAGARTSPTLLAFAAGGDTLLSDGTLPASDDFPVVVRIKAGADAEAVTAKFQCNLMDCPTCDYKEYACVCDHGE